MAVDSSAAFSQRCSELSTPTLNLGELLKAQNIQTFSELAYACGTPNRPPSDAEFQALSDTVLGAGSTMGRIGLLRRLHFEASTLVLSQLKSTVTGDADGARRLPFAEKQARILSARQDIHGFLIQGETEPSFALIDKCQAMFDTGVVIWLPPSVCTKRDSEIQAIPKDSHAILKIEASSIKVDTEGPKIAEADHGSEIKLQWCWQRRGVALEMCKILSWNISQKWLATMFTAYSADCPAGFSKVTLQQLISADKALWTLLAQNAVSVKPDSAGARPLDELVNQLMTDPRVTMHMLALPHKAPPQSSDKNRQDSSASRPQTQPKKKAKSRPGKQNRVKPSPPDELKDCHQQTSDGQPICWSNNLSAGCKLPVSGNPPRCRRGVHVCAFCLKTGHNFQTCKAAPGNRGGS